MSRIVIESLAFMVVGIVLIVQSRGITQNYVDGYDKQLKWVLGPLSRTFRSHLWVVASGILFILIGLGGLAGFFK